MYRDIYQPASLDGYKSRTDISRYVSGAVCLLLTFFGLLYSFVVMAGPSDAHSNAVSARQQLVSQFNTKTTRPDRQQMALSLVTLHQKLGNGNVPLIDNAVLNQQQRDRLVATLKSEAQTGNWLKLDKLPPFTGWQTFGKLWVPLAIGSALLLSCLWRFCLYAVDCLKYKRRLTSFSGWPRPYLIWFVIYTSIPVGWLFYLSSWLRAKRLSRRLEAEHEQIAKEETTV